MVKIYTDGCCHGNPGKAGWGYVIVDGKREWESYGHIPHGTNNIAELTAILECLKYAPASPVTIITDSKYAIGVLQDWRKRWEKNGFKIKGRPVANLELIKQIYGLLDQHGQIKFKWCRGHSGDKYNELADELAEKGAMRK